VNGWHLENKPLMVLHACLPHWSIKKYI
jgi:hypothetical protein